MSLRGSRRLLHLQRSTCRKFFFLQSSGNPTTRNYCSQDPSDNPHYNDIYQRFRDAQIPDAASSAKWIAASEPSIRETLVTCRLARMPLQYILKEWPFRNLTLQMKPPVFIPRPETEKIIDLAKALKPKHVLEIGCGSGAISLALLSEVPSIESIIAVDKSQMAVDLTNENAVRLFDGSSNKFRVLRNPVTSEGCFEEDIPSEEAFDLVISNPPYVLRKDLHNVEPEISLYEDLRALDGGPDGLDVIKAILTWASGAKKHFPPSDESRLLLEVDPCHVSVLIPQYLEASPHLGIAIESTHKDFLDRERFMVLRKKRD